MPVMIRMSVLFPAPFSPTRAWISPGSKRRLTSARAVTPGNPLPMLLSSSMKERLLSRRLEIFRPQLGDDAVGDLPHFGGISIDIVPGHDDDARVDELVWGFRRPAVKHQFEE